ncbi:MAG: BACON domain-containing protein [Bacteroidales bacterium]|nr:BACON domain-containing protein [Bacteroidales bacterium]
MPDASAEYYIGFEGNAKYGYGVCLDDVLITGTPVILLVTPQNQDVNAQAGTIDYIVESNSAWTATSNQTWCSVTPAGNGDGAISAVYDANTAEFSRIAEITVTANGIDPCAGNACAARVAGETTQPHLVLGRIV